MTSTPIARRRAIAGIAAAAAAAVALPTRAATKVRFQTSWFAEAEHGGFYQAQATGRYARAGLDVTLLQGSAQVNSAQMLAGGETDLMMGSDLQTLTNVEKGVPMIAVGSTFQFDLQCIVAHPSVRSLAELKGHTILVSSDAHTTFWPWLVERYGYTDDQVQPYSYSYQRFIDDPAVAQQGYITYDDYALKKAGVRAKLFLLADDGYPAYGSPIVTTRAYLAANRAVVERFVRASLAGWKSYLRDPSPGNALILAANPTMTAGQIDATVAKLRAIRALARGDAARLGIGCMTDARWKATRDYMVRAGLLDARTDWRAAYTTEIGNRAGVFG